MNHADVDPREVEFAVVKEEPYLEECEEVHFSLEDLPPSVKPDPDSWESAASDLQERAELKGIGHSTTPQATPSVMPVLNLLYPLLLLSPSHLNTAHVPSVLRL